METITIPVQVTPDLVVTHETYSYGNNKEININYYIFSHDMVLVKECDANGEVKSYASTKYYGCRIRNGKIEVLDPRNGWAIDHLATEKYANIKAEEALLA